MKGCRIKGYITSDDEGYIFYHCYQPALAVTSQAKAEAVARRPASQSSEHKAKA